MSAFRQKIDAILEQTSQIMDAQPERDYLDEAVCMITGNWHGNMPKLAEREHLLALNTFYLDFIQQLKKEERDANT